LPFPELTLPDHTMATKRSTGLGRGLEALLGPALEPVSAGAPANTPSTLLLSQLQAGKYQPRTRMDEGSLYELAESIKSQGIIQPILVRSVGSGRYEIIAGERRFRAAKLAGINSVPVLVKEVPDESAAVMALIENIQREDLNPLEEAQGIDRLVREFALTHEQAAQAVGRSRSATSNLLRLLQLAEPVQTMLMAGDIEMGHARALLPLGKTEQITAAHQVVARKLNARETESLVKKLSAEFTLTATPSKPAGKSRDVQRLEEELADLLAASVEIRLKKKSKRGQAGELAVSFDSLDELEGILQKLRGVS
jgi:ParB family transcriptional regulator, chromosome partitioning protein